MHFVLSSIQIFTRISLISIFIGISIKVESIFKLLMELIQLSQMLSVHLGNIDEWKFHCFAKVKQKKNEGYSD